MRITLLHDYRGKPSQEQFYAAGVYDTDMMPAELMDYLIMQGWARLVVDAVPKVVETSTVVDIPEPKVQRKAK